MRKILSILFLGYCLFGLANDFVVFEKDGYFGIKDKTGNVTVPAVYEKLGWSDGSSSVQNGVIGFREKNLWGLITVRNKAITGQKFYSIVPLAPNHFKASFKGKFSNRLFYGIIDSKGKTLISFKHFSIESFGTHWLISDFENKEQKFGVVSYENQLLIPPKYQSIRLFGNLYLCELQKHKFDIFDGWGNEKQLGIDSLVKGINGVVAFRDGYAGYLSSNGDTVYDFSYKNFISESEAVNFPEWVIYKGDSILLTRKCDSLTVSNSGLLIAYLNGASHFVLKNETLSKNYDLILKNAIGDYLIVQSSKNRKWSVLNLDGLPLIKRYDSIQPIENHFAAINSDGWYLFNSSGVKQNRLPFERLQSGISGQVIAKKNNHWGVIGVAGNDVTTFKYDSISNGDQCYFVSYLNRWGAMDHTGNWIIRPEFNEILSVADLIIGRRGKGYTIYNNGIQTYKTSDRPHSMLGGYMLVTDENGRLGIFKRDGTPLTQTKYDNISLTDEMFVLREQNKVSMITKSGNMVIDSKEGYQAITNSGEGYFLVKKENKWGLVDDMGRLRISNRYDSAGVFHNGMAPIKLRAKWGFINKSEDLLVQPYYDWVSSFNDEIAIVQLDGKYGLIDQRGKEVLELMWKSVFRLNSGNYIVQNMEDRVGLVDPKGRFILRPAYDNLKDFGDRIVVSKNGIWGVLDYYGRPIFKINHEEIKVIGNLTMIKS
ncbi:WG containing repeat-containing protein [Ekhidna lutea]|uniref:WG containing repeat-containing protein n=1 Tax=Ekhidna lutea TaxID=447679 RepID=A0A239FLW0_EKHLU|nr:WG repeat-containing protein [Ekhidna lutea]SNS57791.1 WG containing repeat-containing protein [Ekhidna lutea]